MKKIILLTLIFLASSQFAIAQQAIAKIKYEEAEEAFSTNDFETTVLKLNEAETLLKATNPRIMYLKILAQSKIIEKAPLNDYKILENTRLLGFKYLKDYENLPNNEDKYRDIYKTTEALKVYPENETKFLLEKQKIQDAEKERQDQLVIDEKLQKDESDRKLKEEMLKPEKQRKKEAKLAEKTRNVEIEKIMKERIKIIKNR